MRGTEIKYALPPKCGTEVGYGAASELPMCGTEVGYGAQAVFISPTEIVCPAPQRLVTSPKLTLTLNREVPSETTNLQSPHDLRASCAIFFNFFLPGCVCQRACFDMSGICLRARYALPGTEVAHLLPGRCASMEVGCSWDCDPDSIVLTHSDGADYCARASVRQTVSAYARMSYCRTFMLYRAMAMLLRAYVIPARCMVQYLCSYARMPYSHAVQPTQSPVPDHPRVEPNGGTAVWRDQDHGCWDLFAAVGWRFRLFLPALEIRVPRHASHGRMPVIRSYNAERPSVIVCATPPGLSASARATRCPAGLTLRMVYRPGGTDLLVGHSLSESAYARTIPCPVLTSRMRVPGIPAGSNELSISYNGQFLVFDFVLHVRCDDRRGRDLAHAATRSARDHNGHQPAPTVADWRRSGATAYARATRCPVLTYA
eukprot:1847679-Rhodomonas_salina.2